jgi:hypothetical protein
MVMNAERVRNWKEVVVAHFRVSWNFPGKTT